MKQILITILISSLLMIGCGSLEDLTNPNVSDGKNGSDGSDGSDGKNAGQDTKENPIEFLNFDLGSFQGSDAVTYVTYRIRFREKVDLDLNSVWVSGSDGLSLNSFWTTNNNEMLGYSRTSPSLTSLRTTNITDYNTRPKVFTITNISINYRDEYNTLITKSYVTNLRITFIDTNM